MLLLVDLGWCVWQENMPATACVLERFNLCDSAGKNVCKCNEMGQERQCMVSVQLGSCDCTPRCHGVCGTAFAEELGLGRAGCKARIIRRPELCKCHWHHPNKPTSQKHKGFAAESWLASRTSLRWQWVRAAIVRAPIVLYSRKTANFQPSHLFSRRLNSYFHWEVPPAWSSQGLSKAISHNQPGPEWGEEAAISFRDK